MMFMNIIIMIITLLAQGHPLILGTGKPIGLNAIAKMAQPVDQTDVAMIGPTRNTVDQVPLKVHQSPLKGERHDQKVRLIAATIST